MNLVVMKAGGSGNRMNGVYDTPKQFIEIEGKPIFIHSLYPFEKSDKVDKIIIACHKDYLDLMWEQVKKFNITKVSDIVPGAETSFGSFLKGVDKAREYLTKEDDLIIMSDAVRPLTRVKDIDKVIDKAKEHKAAVLGMKISSPIFKRTANDSETSTDDSATYDYIGIENVYADFTPHAMTIKTLDDAMNLAKEKGTLDSVACLWHLVANSGTSCAFVQGSDANIKVTFEHHIKMLKALFSAGVDVDELG